MRQRLQSLLVFVVAALFATSTFAQTIAASGGAAEREVIVKVRDTAGSNELSGLTSAGDVDKTDKLSHARGGALYRLHSRSKNTDALIEALKHNPNIEYVEPNYILHLSTAPNDPEYGNLWAMKNTGQTIYGYAGSAGADISAEAAWNVTTGSANIVVGVVDTGIDYDHPDLAANVWSNPGGKGNAQCAAGTHGFNAITRTCDPKDDNGHGTHTSGTIGAVGNNNLGVVGVNHTTSIMALKFLNANGNGTTADAVAAIDFAVQAKLDGVNLRVLSNSWSGSLFAKSLLDEINKANDNDILFVAAAGNSALNNDTYPSYPTSYATPNMISVAATDNRDNLAYFSNYGPATVHLGAPGVDILSTVPTYLYGTSYPYAFYDGTSMATPHVAGVAALVLAHTPGLTTAQVKSAILDNVDPIQSLAGWTTTGGRLNAARALGIAPSPSFRLSISPYTLQVVPGTAATFAVSITPQNGFNGPVDLSVSNLPTGAVGTFSPNPATSASTLTITTPQSMSLGYYLAFNVNGTSGAITRGAYAYLYGVSTLPPPAPCGGFSSHSSLTTSTPVAIVSGDFNRDGRTDLVGAIPTTNRLVVFLGLDGGGFSGAYTNVVGSAPSSIITADFNGDGKSDLATANTAGGNLSVLLGNGDGSFQNPVQYGAGGTPYSITSGDFNRDGKLDLAVANNTSNNVSVLLGNGDGTFQAAVNYASAAGPYFITTGDLEGDGKLDLVVAAYNAGKVSVLPGNGDGTFGAAVNFTAGTKPAAVAVGDLNGDGKADVVASNYGSGNVSVLIGDGAGSLAAAVNYQAAVGTQSVVIGDFNGDGIADVVTASENGYASVFLGSGGGALNAAANYVVGSQAGQVIVTDLNGDGRPDLATASYAEISLLYNAGVCSLNCGALSSAVNYSAGTTPDGVASADFNRDGKADLVIANKGSNNVSIKLGNGNGTFQDAGTYNAGTNPTAVVAGDFNRDGKADVAVANDGSNNVSLLLGNNNGTFQAAQNSAAGTNPRSLAAGDFDRDGKLDLAVANYGGNNVSILRGNADGTFQAAVSYTTGTNPDFVAVGDFNRDGIADLAVANAGSANVSVLLGKADGTFNSAVSYGAGTTPYAIAVADLNRDGKLDLAVANSGSNNVSVLNGNGDGTFQTATNITVGTAPRAIAAADYSDDGRLDLAVANNGSNNVSLLLGTLGGFGTAINTAAGTAPAAILARDFNRDGKPDVVVVNGSSNNASILLDSCPIPDLTVTKTHSGNFSQGATGRTYTITVTNAGANATTASVTVVDTLPPSGITATAMSGSGWTCSVGTLTCTRSDALAAGASFPPITLTVTLSSTAPASLTNQVAVSGGGEINTANDTASDQTTISPATDLIITSAHSGSFAAGDSGRSFTLTVRNLGGLASSGTVTVTDTLPDGMNVQSIAGSGWSCNNAGVLCTRGDSLAGGAAYPPITLTVSVGSDAPVTGANVAAVSGGNETNTLNDTAVDPTTIWGPVGCAGFTSPAQFNAGTYVQNLIVRDLDSDGKPDIVAVAGSSGKVLVFKGYGDGTFAAPVAYAVGYNPYAIIATDLNHDGKVDLAVSYGDYYSSPAAGVATLLGNGDATFAAAHNYSAGAGVTAIATGDFNGDGNVDLAFTLPSIYKFGVMLGNGDGSLGAVTSYRLSPTTNYSGNAIVAGDFNGDGKLDVVVARYDANGEVLFAGNGDGTFQTPVVVGDSYNTLDLAADDFNRDGKPDLVVLTDGSVTLYTGNGDGTFGKSPITASFCCTARDLNTEDINGDGKADITFGAGYNGLITLKGNGDGTFGPASTIYTGYSYVNSLAISDFNGDGKPDFATTTDYSTYISLMFSSCPDLKITKTHYGNFIGGQSGLYTITVSNIGGSTLGTVTVTDSLPAPLQATDIQGYGWTCDLQNLTCTRSDSLAPGGTWALNVTVSVPRATSTTVTNIASVSGGGDANTGNNTASDPTTIVQAADLIVASSHSGNFAVGQTGRTFTITVGNAGGAPTAGTVTMTDTVPTGMVATAASGQGWSCSVSSQVTCMRADPLGATAAYPPITVTVSVQSSNNIFPGYASNNVSVSGGGELNTNNNYANDSVGVIGIATGLNAIAVSTTQVSLSWNGVPYATSYVVYRSMTLNGTYAQIGTTLTSSFLDSTAQANFTYLYKVVATDGTNSATATGIEIATTMLFTDDPPVIRYTKVKALHVTEMRAAINAVRAAAGLPAATYTDPNLTAGMYIKTVHFSELRTNLDAARSALGLAPITYTDPSLAKGLLIKAAHLRDLRLGVK